MKNWVSTYLLFFPLTVLAQIDIYNNSLTDKKQDILYRGIYNRITVSGFGDDTTLSVTSATGKVLNFEWNKDPNLFFIRAGNADTDSLSLYRANKLLLTRSFQVANIGDPIAQLGDIADSSASIQQIIENHTLNVIIPDCYYDHGFRVFSFKVALLESEGDTLKTFGRINGNELTKAQIRSIERLQTGDEIAFSEITATCPDCALRRLNPLTITIR